MKNQRALYNGVRLGLLTAALVCIALGARTVIASFDAREALTLGAMLALYIAVLRAPVPFYLPARGSRRLPAQRIAFELPLIAVTLTLYGGVACAALILAAHICAFSPDQRQRLVPRILDAGTEATLWLVAGLARDTIFRDVAGASGFLWFTGVYAAGALLYAIALWAPLVALRDGIPLNRLLRRHGPDARAIAVYAILGAWGWFSTVTLLRQGGFFGVVALLPVVAIGVALRRLHVNSQELQRLRLARNAVQALLDARDPVPQINSLLSTIHAHDDRVTLQIFSAASNDRSTPLASIGPVLHDEQSQLIRQALIQAHHTDRTSVSLRSRDYVVTAYPVRSARGALTGTLLVHRPARTQTSLGNRRFEAAATELAPLLAELRSITQTQTAARVDALTGLANRRTILVRIRAQIDEVSTGAPCAVMLIDVDRFKSINDNLGHLAGDHVLRTLGRVIARNIRNDDCAGRVGGEEFVILMPATTRDVAITVAERLRRAILGADLKYSDGETVSVSIGVTVAEVSDSVESLLARADRALYEAKRQGRNRVVEMSA